MNTQISKIEAQMSHIEAVRGQLFETRKVQLHPNIEGFESPDSFGIYKTTGGNVLGCVGKNYEPPNLHLLLDVVTSSLMECCPKLDLTKLEFRQWKDGQKCGLYVPIKDFKIKSPQVGDVLKSDLSITTGFDGYTAYNMKLRFYRLWCENGSGSWENHAIYKFKNTILNQTKVPYFASKIVETIATTDKYKEQLNELVKIKVTKKQMQDYIKLAFGYDIAEIEDMNKKSRNTLDAINRSIGIETENTGMNLYSLLQGATRYLTHERASDYNDLLFNPTIEKMNTTVHKAAFAIAESN